MTTPPLTVTLQTSYRENGKRYRIKATAALVQLEQNPRPYFSVTGEIHEIRRNGRHVEMTGGAIHEQILKHFSILSPVVALHLSDDTGLPTHAYANAAYFAGHTVYNDALNLDVLARHLRVSRDIAETLANDARALIDSGSDRVDAWRQVCETAGLPAQWQHEAIHAKHVIATIGAWKVKIKNSDGDILRTRTYPNAELAERAATRVLGTEHPKGVAVLAEIYERQPDQTWRLDSEHEF